MNQGQQQDGAVENPTMRRFGGLNVSITRESCPLSISTRAVGLMLPKVTDYLKRANLAMDSSSDDDYDNESEEIEAPLSAMYRVSLAQLEAKVHHAASNQRLFLNTSVYDPSSQYDVQPTSLLYSIMNNVTSRYDIISPVSVIINSIGHVETNGMHYEPKFTKKVTPLNLRISNLRKYCENMANSDTSAEDRKTGYLLNPIPNAKWENENDLEFVKLKNPDDIISADYDMNSFRNDCRTVEDYLERIRARETLTFQKTIDYKGFGNPGILASTQVKLGESCRLNENNEICTDTAMTFWSRENLTPDSWSIGVLTLAGEVLRPVDDPHRSQMLAVQELIADHWSAISGVFLRFNY